MKQKDIDMDQFKNGNAENLDAKIYQDLGQKLHELEKNLGAEINSLKDEQDENYKYWELREKLK